jgi:hypothetical protein
MRRTFSKFGRQPRPNRAAALSANVVHPRFGRGGTQSEARVRRSFQGQDPFGEGRVGGFEAGMGEAAARLFHVLVQGQGI